MYSLFRIFYTGNFHCTEYYWIFPSIDYLLNFMNIIAFLKWLIITEVSVRFTEYYNLAYVYLIFWEIFTKMYLWIHTLTFRSILFIHTLGILLHAVSTLIALQTSIGIFQVKIFLTRSNWDVRVFVWEPLMCSCACMCLLIHLCMYPHWICIKSLFCVVSSKIKLLFL